MLNKISDYSRFLIVLSYFCAFISNSEQNEERKRSIAMVTMEQVPYGYISSDGNTIGGLYEILNEIILESELGKTNQLMPPKRIYLHMMAKEEMCTLVADVPSIVSNFDLIEPIGYELQAGILPKAGIKIQNYSDLKNLIIAVPLGVNFYDKFDNDSSLTKAEPPEYVNAIRMLNKGRVDAIAGAINNLKFIAKMKGMRNDTFDTPFILAKHNIYLVCTSSISKISRMRLRQSVIKLRENGTINAILKRYFHDSNFHK